MPGQGRAPKPQAERRNHVPPSRGEWKRTELIGWQHGPTPKPPPRLTKVSKETWDIWFAAWWAAHWQPEDLPVLRQIICLYDAIERQEASAAELSQFRQLIDTYGITPKGQQDRRWAPPAAEPVSPKKPTSRNRPRLKVV